MLHEQNKINNILFLTDKEGNSNTFKVLFTCHSDITNKDYAVFYNEADENNLIAFSFTDCNNLMAVKEDIDFEELEKALKEFDNR